MDSNEKHSYAVGRNKNQMVTTEYLQYNSNLAEQQFTTMITVQLGKTIWKVLNNFHSLQKCDIATGYLCTTSNVHSGVIDNVFFCKLVEICHMIRLPLALAPIEIITIINARLRS